VLDTTASHRIPLGVEMRPLRTTLAIGAVVLAGALPLVASDRVGAGYAGSHTEAIGAESAAGRIGGTACRRVGQTRTTSVASFRCTKVGRTLRWRRVGVTPTTTTVTNSPQPKSALTSITELSPVHECKIRTSGADFEGDLVRSGFPRVPDAALPRQEAVVVVIPVEFPNLRSAVSPSALLKPIADGVTDYYARVSGNRIRFTWRLAGSTTRMPFSVEHYNLDGRNNGFSYMQEVLSAADSEVDFSDADFVLALHPETATLAQIATSPAQQMIQRFKFQTNEGAVYRTTYTSPRTLGTHGWLIIAHEFGHGLGLPDLYNFAGTPSFMGRFDIMADLLPTSAIELTAWSKWQLGFIDDTQVHCLNAGQSARLWISHVSAGTDRPEMIVIPSSMTSAFVIEARRRERFDANAPFAPVADGLLVYEVNTAYSTGRGPLRAVQKPGSSGPGSLDGLLGINERTQIGRLSISSIESGPWGHVVEIKALS
jgi:M6 family metalloprotease-like protein